MKHYKSVTKATAWTDQQAVAASSAPGLFNFMDEFDTVPRNYIEKVPGEAASIFETL